jgi:hypothetical protein
MTTEIPQGHFSEEKKKKKTAFHPFKVNHKPRR